MKRPRVLVLSRNYPNPAMPTLGLWVRRMVEAGRDVADATVVAPVPWVPPIPLPDDYRRHRRVPDVETSDDGTPVHHPRVPLLPGSRFQALESHLFLPALRKRVGRLHRRAPFDLIHAHFIHPDGVIAARLGRELGIPVVTTEHAHWIPWMESRPATWRRVRAALEGIDTVTAVSEGVRAGIERLTGGRVRTEVLPNVLDDEVFTTAPGSFDPARILFVGVIRRVKGFDVLLDALARIAGSLPDARLQVVGDPFYRSYRKDFDDAMARAAELGLTDRVELCGALDPAGVAEAMRRAAVLVVPSRRESFSSVTVEALACGTPVVATRCGGPETILTPDTGVLVEPGDATALAHAVTDVLARRGDFVPERLRRHAVERYGRAAARERLRDLYERVGGRVRGPAPVVI
jgi:glycosyltransferase involved in cell wall biosynthesis